MTYSIALSVRFEHDYWADHTPPVAIEAEDHRAFRHMGLIMRSFPAGIDIIAPSTEDVPEVFTVDLMVNATSSTLRDVTVGLPSSGCLELQLDQGTQDETINLTSAAKASTDPQSQMTLCRIKTTISANRTRRVCIRAQAPETLWAYHLTGAVCDAPLQITDPEEKTTFKDLGLLPIPGDQRARVFRSTTPIPLRRRSANRFRLCEQQGAPFDPITLVPVLPAPATAPRRIDDPTAIAPLQSDIFVSLW